jgi:hypothetical protein
MAFDWRDFLSVAKSLKTQTDAGLLGPDAMYRTIVGRAYYAAFGLAHEYATRWLGFRPKIKAEERSQDHGDCAPISGRVGDTLSPTNCPFCATSAINATTSGTCPALSWPCWQRTRSTGPSTSLLPCQCPRLHNTSLGKVIDPGP